MSCDDRSARALSSESQGKSQGSSERKDLSALRYVPAFDGLRTIAVGAVLVYHTLSNSSVAWITYLAQRGWYGVDVFFVLSGFLITLLLTTELDQTRRIDIPRFYVRRALRLQPAYLSAISLMVAGHLLTGGFATALQRLPYLLTYTFNIAIALRWIPQFGGLLPAWTLCIEEQFYLVWPNVLARVKESSALKIAICGVFVVAIYRTLLYIHGASFVRIYHSTDTRFDTLLVGCSAALLLRRGVLDRIITWPWFPPLSCLLCAACLTVGLSSQAILNTFGYTVMAISVAFVIVAIYSRKEFLLTRMLSWPFLVSLGRISYGMYIFQSSMVYLGLTIMRLPWAPNVNLGKGLTLLVITAILDVGISWVHYQLIEKRVLSLRDSLSLRRATS